MGCLRVWLSRQDAFVTIAFFTLCIVRQENSEGPDNMDLRYPPLSPTAAPVCASLNPLNVRLSLTLEMPNPGIADSLLTVSMSVKCHLDLAQNPSNSHCIGRVQSGFSMRRIIFRFVVASSCKQFISAS